MFFHWPLSFQGGSGAQLPLVGDSVTSPMGNPDGDSLDELANGGASGLPTGRLWEGNGSVENSISTFTSHHLQPGSLLEPSGKAIFFSRTAILASRSGVSRLGRQRGIKSSAPPSPFRRASTSPNPLLPRFSHHHPKPVMASSNEKRLDIEPSAAAAAIKPTPTSNAIHGMDETAATQQAINNEREMSLRDTIRLWPKAILFSFLISLCIIMEGYDTNLMSNFYAYPAFKNHYGDQVDPDGGRLISSGWQTAISNSTQVSSPMFAPFSQIPRLGSRS